jgi:ElaB/YqjD/DUF883 family membrane-anchored ribosome-binding protein
MTEREDPGAPEHRDPREIEAEIAQTRAEISERLHEIGGKLRPVNVREEAKEAVAGGITGVKEAAMEKLRETKEHMVESVSEKVHLARDRARDAGSATVSFARENPVPLALIGIGLGWMWVSARRRSMDRKWRPPAYREEYAGEYAGTEGYGESYEPGRVRQAAESTRERAEEVASRAAQRVEHGVQQAREKAHEAREKARELGHRASELGHRAEARVEEFVSENPLAVGAAALAAGVGIGLLVPRTRRENRLFGGARERVVGDVRESFQEVGRAVSDTAREVKGTLTPTAHH